MKRNVGERIGSGIVCAALSASCLGMSFSAARKNGQGGDLYQKGDYENALKKYSEAMTEAPEKPQLYFNIGDVLYRQSKFPEAVKLYEKSTAPGDPELQSKSWYNIGNAKFRAAGKGGDPGAMKDAAGKGGDPGAMKEAAGKGGDPNAMKEAAACYIKSLEADPDDMDAKYNLEFVQRALKQQQQEQKKDQKDQKQDQKEQQKEQQQKEQEKKEEKQEQKSQEQKEQEKKEQEKKEQEQQQKEQEKKGEKQEKKEQQKEQEKKEPEQSKQEEKPAGEAAQAEKSEQPDKDLSEQQARQLIESLEREERDPTHLMKAEGSPQPRDVDKDW